MAKNIFKTESFDNNRINELKDEDIEYINKDIDPLTYNYNNVTIRDIKDKYIANKGNFSEFYVMEKYDKSLRIMEGSETKAIIFGKPLKVFYIQIPLGTKKIKCDINVLSTIQIDEFFKEDNPSKIIFNFENQEYSYNSSKTHIPSDKDLMLYYYITPYKFVSYGNRFIEKEVEKENKNITKDNMSKYFDHYFKSNTINNKNEFYYYVSDSRENLKKNFQLLVDEKNVTKFKITGPSNNGKSTTLLYLSRLYLNIVYLNLNVIYSLYSEGKIGDVLDILLYEFGRINFPNDISKNAFEKTFNISIEKNIWELIIELINCLTKMKDLSFVLILDQYKSSPFDTIIYKQLKDKLNSHFKLIISFSISDNKDFNEIANSLQKNKGNPKILSENNQNDYFYYCNLLNKEGIKDLKKNSENYQIYQLFDFIPKFIDNIDNYSKNYIINAIINYFEFHSKKIGLNFHVYLFNYTKSVNRKYSFNELYDITTKIPMKYSYLEFKEDYFIIKYQFNYLETLVNDALKMEKVLDYFKENKDKSDDFETKLKGEYFEALACDIIKRNKSIYFGDEIKNFLTVNEIISMNAYENNENLNIIIENFENSQKIKTITNKESYDKMLHSLDRELEILNSNNNIKENSKEVNFFKYETFTQKKSLLNKKRYFSTEIEKNEEKNSEEEDEIKENKENLKKTQKAKTSKKRTKSKIEIEKEKFEKNLNTKINIVEYDDNFINNGILISQKNPCGKVIDLAALLGPSREKKFISFQIKYYEKGTHLKNPNEFEKINLKEKLKSVLVNCLTNFNINITEWHFFFCFYYNPNDKYSYNKSLETTCNNNDVEFILFDPNEHKFYDRNFELINEKFKLTYRSNLDCLSSTNPYIILQNKESLEKYSNQRTQNPDLTCQSSELIFDLKKEEVFKQLNNLNLNKDFELICKFKLQQDLTFPTPENKYLLLFKGKGENNYVYYYNDNNKLLCGSLQKDTYFPAIISNFIDITDINNILFYVFKANEKIK